MTTLKRDIFRRPARMQHYYGDATRTDDPLGVNTFDMPSPNLSRLQAGSRAVEVQTYGMHDVWSPPRSAVMTPSGRMASINGPAPDIAEMMGAPIPMGIKRRVGYLKTDK